MVSRTDFSRRDSIDPSNIPTTQEIIKLNFNENALGMPNTVKQAILEHLDLGYLYPDPQRDTLITKIAALNGVDQNQVSLGNGSSENIRAIIEMLLTKTLKNDEKYQVIIPVPTFNLAEFYATFLNISVVKVPVQQHDFSFDIQKMQKIADEFDGISLFYLANPNNPTSTIIKPDTLKSWVTNAPDNHYFLLDEAYSEYITDSDFESGIEWIKQGLSENLIVTRTFSKVYALAGLRIGYAISTAELIDACESFMSVDNTNIAGAVAATVVLDNNDFVKASLETNTQSRTIVEEALDELGLHYLDSQSSFIFHEIKGSIETYQARMLENGFLVGREFLPIQGYNRLTLGTPEQMRKFVATLRVFREKDWI